MKKDNLIKKFPFNKNGKLDIKKRYQNYIINK